MTAETKLAAGKQPEQPVEEDKEVAASARPKRPSTAELLRPSASGAILSEGVLGSTPYPFPQRRFERWVSSTNILKPDEEEDERAA